MKRRRLVLHIGTHKTASTSIQEMLGRLSQELTEEDILIPSSGSRILGSHHHLAWDCFGDGRFDSLFGGMDSLRDEISGSDAPLIVVSSETFTARPGQKRQEHAIESLRRLGNELNLELQVIAYVRPQWTYLDSLYTQQVKMGFHSLHFDEFVSTNLNKSRFDYNVVFSTWKSHFPNLTIRVFEKGRLPGGVLEDFMSFLGIAHAMEKPVPMLNRRIGAVQLEVIRMATSEMISQGIKKPVRKAIAAKLLHKLLDELPDDEPFSGLDDDLAGQLSDRFRESNHRFAIELNIDPEGNLFDGGMDLESGSVSTNFHRNIAKWDELDLSFRTRLSKIVVDEIGVSIE